MALWLMEESCTGRIPYMGIGVSSLYYGFLYLDSYYNTGPYINFPHFGNSNLGKLPHPTNGSRKGSVV